MSTFKIMTFNIQGSDYDLGDNNWEYTYQLNVDTIKKYDPDLIGFQEHQDGNRATYAEHLPYYDYELGPMVARENDSGKGYYCAIYWRANRFEKLDQGYYFLNETPWVYALHWDVVQGRGINWVKLQDKQTGDVFIHMNTHLPHISETGRRNAAKLIVERTPSLAEGGFPVILTADFNTRAVPMRDEWLNNVPDDYRERLKERPYLWENVPYQTFMAGGFVDSGADFFDDNDPTIVTFHGRKGADYPRMGHRIDWILLRDGTKSFNVNDTCIITDDAPPLYPSDHYPVMSEVVLV